MMKMRSRNKGYLVMRNSFLAVFILSLSQASLFAITKLDKEMQDLEKVEEKKQIAPPEVIVRPRVEYKANDFKNPFSDPFQENAVSAPGKIPEGPQVQEKPLPPLEVQGIIWGGDFPQAIINNKVVKIGDTVEGVTISAIDKDGVEVIFEQTKHRLSSPANVKSAQEPQGGKNEE